MVSKVEKDGSVIFCFSDITSDEEKLIKIIGRFIDGDYSVLNPENFQSKAESKETPKEEFSQEKPKKKYFDFTKEGARKRALEKKRLEEYNRMQEELKNTHQVTEEEAVWAIMNTEGVPF